MKVTNIDNQKVKDKNKIEKIFFHENHPGDHLCPIKDILGHLGDKWSIFAILSLGQAERLRFNELRKHIAGISQRMLTVTLRSLEENGLVKRTLFPEIPPRVEYELTALGRGLLVKMLDLAEWASTHVDEVLQARKQFRLTNKTSYHKDEPYPFNKSALAIPEAHR